MQIQIDDSAPGLRRVWLVGRLDSTGAAAVDLRFQAATAGSNIDAIADLSGVSFIASLGIRILVESSRGLARKGRKLVLVVPAGLVAETLFDAGIDQIVPIVTAEADALALLSAS